jgi:hypothetical protein
MLEYWSVNELISIGMYGIVNKSIEDLVKVNFGDDKWEAVKHEVVLMLIFHQQHAV